MNGCEKAQQYLEARFRRESVIVGTPESIAQGAGFTTLEVEQALANLVGENKIRPFQDDEGILEYQWKESYTV